MKIPNYRIKHEIGKGGMATVYLAIQESLERQVALKIMSPELVANSDFCARFLKEGRMIAQLNHPYIISVFDIGFHENLYYMALQYASSGNLVSRIQRGVSVPEALQLLSTIALPLGFAHASGIIHRDIKPDNILFENDETPLLSDFGIAKALADTSNLTQAGATIGTPKYMSPEQLSGKSVSNQADIYSLGIVFYEMLTRRCPYEGNTYSLIYQHMTAPIPQLPETIGFLQPLLEKLLAKNPQERFASAEELIQAIQRIETEHAGLSETTPIPSLDAVSSGTAAARHKALTGSGAMRAVQKTDTPAFDTTLPMTPAPKPATTPAAKPGATATPVPLETVPVAIPPQTEPAPIQPADQAAKRSGKTAVFVGAGLLALTVAGGIYYYATLQDGSELIIPQHSFQLLQPQEIITQKLTALRDAATAYRNILRIDSDNGAARNGLQEVVDRYAQLAKASLTVLDKQLSLNIIAEGLMFLPQHPELLALKQTLETPLSEAERNRKIASLLEQAETYLRQGRFTYPIQDNAVAFYQQVLQLDPNQETARQRLNELADIFEQQARSAFRNKNIRQAITSIEQGLLVNPRHKGLLALATAAEARSDHPDAVSNLP